MTKNTSIYKNLKSKPSVDIDLNFRLMEPTDCAAVAELQSSLDYGGWSEKQWAEALEHYPCSWVLVVEGRKTSQLIIGYVIYQTKVSQIELLNLGIKSSHQGRGLASELLKSSMSLLPPLSESIFLEVRRSNVPAIQLYEKLSFESVGVRRDYYAVAGGAREDALIYRYDFNG